MTRISVDRPDVDEMFRWDTEASVSARDGATFYMDVTGQNRTPDEKTVDLLEPRLDDLGVVGVFVDEDERDVKHRREVVEQSGGERPLQFYDQYFSESDGFDVMYSRLELDGIEEVKGEVRDIEQGLRTHPEFNHGRTRFGTGFEQRFIESDGVADALKQLDEDIGFQVFFSYTGDREASQTFEEYTDNAFMPSSTEGVTGVVCAGRYEEPVVYMAGPRDIDVSMASFPGYDDSVQQEHLADIL